jgi:hypothetical protein
MAGTTVKQKTTPIEQARWRRSQIAETFLRGFVFRSPELKNVSRETFALKGQQTVGVLRP